MLDLKKKIDLIKNITLLNLTKRELLNLTKRELLNLTGTKITKRELLNLTKKGRRERNPTMDIVVSEQKTIFFRNTTIILALSFALILYYLMQIVCLRN